MSVLVQSPLSGDTHTPSSAMNNPWSRSASLSREYPSLSSYTRCTPSVTSTAAKTGICTYVTTSDQDQDRCRSKEHREAGKSPPQLHIQPDPAAHPHVVGNGHDKDGEGEDLERQASQSNVDPGLIATVGRCRHSSTHCLQDEGDDIARDEDPVEERGRETGRGG